MALVTEEAILRILGIERHICTKPHEMAQTVSVTFFPYIDKNTSEEVKKFAKELGIGLKKLGVKIIPFQETLTPLPLTKLIKWYSFALLTTVTRPILSLLGLNGGNRAGLEVIARLRKGSRVKKGVSIIALGEGKAGDLPMDYAQSFRHSSVVTIVDMPAGIHTGTDFLTHFNTAMNLFAHHMTNIIIGVDKEKWILYNFNAAHPIHLRSETTEHHILHTLIPKLAAPIEPPRLSEFIVREEVFDPEDKIHEPFVKDLVESGTLLETTGLYPPGKSINDLPFRNDFYRWVGQIHLDHRTGMSYGFLARQMPVKLAPLISLKQAGETFGSIVKTSNGYFIADERLYISVSLKNGKFFLEVPEVWVLTQRSGSDKTHFNPKKDLVKMGLSHGRLIIETPKGLRLKSGYRPSYDTKVILAHAVGNAIGAAILKHFNPKHKFPEILERQGMAISHWHGYIKRSLIPQGWFVHGADRPHVSCSTPQSAIFALEGKMRVVEKSIELNEEYLGDIHVEPHHGTNMTFHSLKELGVFLSQNPDATKLGNLYLHEHQE